MFRAGVVDDSLSLASHFIKMIPFGSDQVLATATGFLYDFEDHYYLVTNGHNITRVNPETKERITDTFAFPVKIKFSIRVQVDGPQIMMTNQETFVDLYADTDFAQPLWYIHPLHGYTVDVIAIPVCNKSEVPAHVKLYPINRFDLDEKFYLEASDDIFILGYPFSLSGGKELPIWKRGSVATEPGINLDNLPKFLVDTATRPGMSGAPVIFRRTGLHGFNKEGPPDPNAVIGTITGFVGVYSGRIGSNDQLQAQLGVVWKKNVIEEILQARIIGTTEFQKL